MALYTEILPDRDNPCQICWCSGISPNCGAEKIMWINVEKRIPAIVGKNHQKLDTVYARIAATELQ